MIKNTQLLLLIIVFSSGMLLAEASVYKLLDKEQERIILSNEYWQLTFTPATGGRCTGVKRLDIGVELTTAQHLGLFVDHWANYVWPSGLMHLPYEATLNQDNDKASVSLSIVIPQLGGGKGTATPESSKIIATPEELTGLKLTKTITLKNNSPLITVDVCLENPTDNSKSAALYFQNHFEPGTSKSYIWSMPSTEGLIGPAKAPDGKQWKGPNWCEKPVAGWSGGYDPTDATGMVFVYDYNLLEKMYCSIGTAEWFMEPVTILPGNKFNTTYYARAVDKLDTLVFADKHIYAGRRTSEEGTRVKADFLFATMDGEKDTFDLTCDIIQGRTKQHYPQLSFSAVELDRTLKPLHIEIDLPSPSPQNNLIFHWNISKQGKRISTFESNYTGTESDLRLRYHYGEIVSGAAALAGGGAENTYSIDQPKKIRPRTQVDQQEIRRKAGPATDVLVLFGLYTNYLRIHESLNEQLGDKLHWANGIPTGITGFPGTHEELYKNKLIIMSNINQRSLRDYRLNMLDDYVQEGGTLLICGGFYTFGHGEYSDTAFESFCPFDDMKPFEIIKASVDSPFILRKSSSDNFLSNILLIDDYCEVGYLHAMKVREGAEILAYADDYPAIVTWKYGKGRVVACAMTVMGEIGHPWFDGTWWKNFVKELAK